ncbi:hypothetical protein SFRURICE_007645 [Spodoptera frugiperda]|nr:hypothetical protein SFRURICE_007645 [Spodoptera frugiperda]
MHGLTHFLHKHHRESTPPIEKEDSGDSWYSSLTSTDSRNVLANEGAASSSTARPIPIHQRGSSAHRSMRASSGSPYEFASSPRDRYPNFASYIRDVMERGSPTQHYYTHQPDYRRQRSDGDRYQIGVNTYHAPRSDYRNFVSPLYNDVMDDIQEHEYSKCERYGEISSSKLSHRNRHDNKSFAQKLTESVTGCKDSKDHKDSKYEKNERRGSGSSSSGHRHKHHSIQELIRTFGKKVGHWRHESGEGRRGSCAIPAASTDEARAMDSDEFRSRSKSLDGDHSHKILRRQVLEDCGATYQIFDEILREGIVSNSNRVIIISL